MQATLDAPAVKAVSPVASGRPYTLDDLAILLDADRNLVRKWASRGAIPRPSRKIGKSAYWHRQTFDEWLINQQENA